MVNKSYLKRIVRVLIVSLSRDLKGNQQVLPLAGAFLKAYADKKLNGKCIIATANLFNFNYLQTMEYIENMRPQIVAFSCYLWNLRKVEILCRRIKRKYPRMLIMLGGPEATGRKEEMLKKCGADALVIGEGEETFTELLSRYIAKRSWVGTPGALIKYRGRIFSGPARAELKNLNYIPSPFINARKTLGIYDREKHFYTYETMRGCPNKCTFCVWTQLAARKLRYFSDNRIKNDIRRISENTRGSCVFIADSDMFINHNRALRLAPFFIEAAEKWDCDFIFQTNLNHWPQDLMRAWNHKNFDLNVGVNSIIPSVQKILGRSYSKALVEKKLREMRRFAPKTKITMQIMFAAPGETFANFCASFDWAWRQPINYMLFFHTQPLHGTLMRDNARALGIKYRKNPPYHVLSTRKCSFEEIKMEGIMVLLSSVWMYEPQMRKLYTKLADELHNGSLSKAAMYVLANMSKVQRKIVFQTWKRFNGGSDWFPDDFQLDISHGHQPPGSSEFINTARKALLHCFLNNRNKRN